MIRFSNGHSFQFMAASGALAFDGQGWPWEWPLRWIGLLDPASFTIVTKTLTRHPRPGNLRWSHPWSVVKKIPSPSPFSPPLEGGGEGEGVLNAIGLTNKGIEWWLREISPRIPSHYKVVVSIEANDETETAEMVQMFEGQKILGIELNLSCPNSPAPAKPDAGLNRGKNPLSPRYPSSEEILHICRVAAKVSPFPLIAKLSYTHDYLTLAKNLDPKNIQAIAINSIPWQAIFPEKPSPLSRFGGGGVSGKMIQPYTWKMVEEISHATKIPVIGSSVWDYEDIQEIFRRGAKAISFGSVFVYYPWRPTLFVRRRMREKRGV